MKVANLQLCRELHEVSGWDGTDFIHTRGQGGWMVGMKYYKGKEWVPAYDLGYLLRRLPKNLGIYWLELKFTNNSCFAVYWDENTHSALELDLVTHRIKFDIGGDTPEDAGTKLVIELFEHGLLKHG